MGSPFPSFPRLFQFPILVNVLRSELLQRSIVKHRHIKNLYEKPEKSRFDYFADRSGYSSVCCIFLTLRFKYFQATSSDQGMFLQCSRFMNSDILTRRLRRGKKSKFCFDIWICRMPTFSRDRHRAKTSSYLYCAFHTFVTGRRSSF